MKNIYKFLPLSLLLFAGACNSDEPGAELTQRETYTVMNIVSPEAEGDASASIGSYTIDFNLLASTASIASANLLVGGSTLSFQTQDLSMRNWVEQETYIVNTIVNKGHVPMATSGLKIDNLEMYLTNAVYDLKLPAPGVSNYYATSVGLFMQYDLNVNRQIKTLPPDITFCGSTVTSYPSEEGMQAYQNDDIKYRVVFDVNKKTADVVLYDAKFAPPAPALKGLVLRGLSVTFTNDAGYVIKGTDIVPEAFEGSEAATPNPRYTFNSFEIGSSSTDLTKVTCDYTVASVFKGTFSGSAIRR